MHAFLRHNADFQSGLWLFVSVTQISEQLPLSIVRNTLSRSCYTVLKLNNVEQKMIKFQVLINLLYQRRNDSIFSSHI